MGYISDKFNSVVNAVVDWTADWAKNGGSAALKRNIEADPQISTGDPQFDSVVSDIYERVAREDPKVLKWDENFKAIVGLYDQATKGTPNRTRLISLGDIPEDLKCQEPDLDSAFGKSKALLGAMRDSTMDVLVDKCRRAEHTSYFGMPRQEAIEEFKKRAAQLYAANEQQLPVPLGGPPPFRDPSPYSSDTQLEGTWSEEGSLSSGYYTPVEGAPPAAPPAIPKDRENGIDEIIPISPSPGNPESGAGADQVIQVGYDGSRHRKAQTQGTAVGASRDSNLISPKGLMPATTLKVIFGTTLGFGLVAGVVFLYKKLFRNKRNPAGDARSRIHARSWNIADVEVDVL